MGGKEGLAWRRASSVAAIESMRPRSCEWRAWTCSWARGMVLQGDLEAVSLAAAMDHRGENGALDVEETLCGPETPLGVDGARPCVPAAAAASRGRCLFSEGSLGDIGALGSVAAGDGEPVGLVVVRCGEEGIVRFELDDGVAGRVGSEERLLYSGGVADQVRLEPVVGREDAVGERRAEGEAERAEDAGGLLQRSERVGEVRRGHRCMDCSGVRSVRRRRMTARC